MTSAHYKSRKITDAPAPVTIIAPPLLPLTNPVQAPALLLATSHVSRDRPQNRAHLPYPASPSALCTVYFDVLFTTVWFRVHGLWFMFYDF